MSKALEDAVFGLMTRVGVLEKDKQCDKETIEDLEAKVTALEDGLEEFMDNFGYNFYRGGKAADAT